MSVWRCARPPDVGVSVRRYWDAPVYQNTAFWTVPRLRTRQDFLTTWLISVSNRPPSLGIIGGGEVFFSL
jgi:hypothetical protein